MSARLKEARELALVHHDYSGFKALLPYAQWLGVSVLPTAKGELHFDLPFAPHLTGNPHLPAIHGGVTAAFLETAATLELCLRLDADRLPKCIDFSIDYLRTAACVSSHARCEISRMGRRFAHVQITCWQADPEKPIALARAHFLLSEHVE